MTINESQCERWEAMKERRLFVSRLFASRILSSPLSIPKKIPVVACNKRLDSSALVAEAEGWAVTGVADAVIGPIQHHVA